MPAVCKAALSTGQSRDPVLCSARGLSGSRASLGVFLPPSGAQVRVSLGWPCWRRERADGGPILRSLLSTNLGRSHAANGGRASASGPLVPGTQTFRAAWPALEGSREAKTAGGMCTAGAKQGRGWGETGRPRQDVASAVTGKHGVWTGPGSQPVLNRDNQTLLCPREDALKGSGAGSVGVASSLWRHVDESLPPSCRGEHSACLVGGWGWGKLLP